MKRMTLSLFACCASIACVDAAQAVYVSPQMGGGSVGMMGAPMKHADVMFDGANVSLHVDDTVATPVLRPLTAPDEFDPAQPWSVLSGSHHNYQYAWNPGGLITLPAGTKIWVEVLAKDAELHAYLRPPMYNASYGPTWPEVLANVGDRWAWAGSMQHNAYAVWNPTQPIYSATYRVYIGDATTGVPSPGYGSADVTWRWAVLPEPTSLLVAGSMAVIALRRRGR